MPIMAEELAGSPWLGRDCWYEGGAHALRMSLAQALRGKFRGLEAMPELDLIDGPENLRTLLDLALESEDRALVKHSILAAAQPH